MSVGENLSKEERPPYLRFEKRAIENKAETLKQGHYVARDIDYVYVTLPGGRDVFSSKVDKWLEKQAVYAKNGRIKPEWLSIYKDAYERWSKGEEIPVNGTPIKGWQALSPAQTEIILRAGIRTIEDLEVCNDEALRRLGMGGRDLVNKAKSWLKGANDHGKVAMQNAALEKENENLKTTVSSLEEKVDYLMAQMEQKKDNPTYGDVPRETIDDYYMPEQGKILPAELPLADQYYEKFGKKPHWKMKESTIRAKLEE